MEDLHFLIPNLTINLLHGVGMRIDIKSKKIQSILKIQK